MKLTARSYHFIPLLMLCMAFAVNAQDIHFSQFYNAPLQLNPALAGVFQGAQRITTNFSEQWQTVPVPYTTFGVGYDQKIPLPLFGDGFLSGGILFVYDQSGDANLTWNQLGLSVAYTQPLSEQVFLSGGVQYQFGSRAFAPNQLTYAEQWNGDLFDPTISVSEGFFSDNTSFSTLGAGINLHLQLEGTRSKIDIGSGFFNINQPTISFLNEAQSKLLTRLNGYAIGTLQIHPLMDVRLLGMYHNQSPYQETVVGTALRYHLSLQRSRAISIQLGSSYRLGDAFIPHLEVQYHSLLVGISYDINTSDFEVATRQKGGPELSLQWIITKVKPVPVFKACPIY